MLPLIAHSLKTGVDRFPCQGAPPKHVVVCVIAIYQLTHVSNNQVTSGPGHTPLHGQV
jgi:hypothetical protein